MDIVILLVPFTTCFLLTARSLGLGFLGVFVVGYFSGVIRANEPGIATTFLFDFSLLGLYAGFATFRWDRAVALLNTTAGKFTLCIILWPTLLSLIPINALLVQLVALRATVWFFPVILISSQLKSSDLTIMARGLSILNVAALIGGVYIYYNGVESLYPQNAVTMIIYNSRDVSGFEYHRIPSFFLSAHAYGGTMLLSLPFVLGRVLDRDVHLLERSILVSGSVAALFGIAMCAARQPAVLLFVAIFITWIATRFSLKFGIASVALFLAGLLIVSGNERFQRITTLEDTEALSDRIRSSANENFFETIFEYPVGAGMGSSAGTSIPIFLSDSAPVAIGLENEYSRISVDQGILGLLLWLTFLVWLLYRFPSFSQTQPWGTTVTMAYSFVLTSWITAFIGAGTLSSIPGSVLLLACMGLIIKNRADVKR